AALHAGVSAAYAYPGTPSTEIFEFLAAHAAGLGVRADWCANEKTAYEQALGVSMAGRRALVSMKHVGLNVAADPFINSALVEIGGGLVVAVADDPGMHSSQNEQDSRYLADFARIVCLEPANQQEAYDMTREAFDLSERFHIPVMVRLVTRLCHSRALVEARPSRDQNPVEKAADPADWTLLPSISRRLWKGLLDLQPRLRDYSDHSGHHTLAINDGGPVGVVTTGLARNYFLENRGDLEVVPPHLHIGAYPVPDALIRQLSDGVDRILVIEEGYPFVERRLRGVLPHRWEISGKEDGTLPLDGELTPDSVRTALGLAPRPRITIGDLDLPGRPPQLCKGCPHRDSYDAVAEVLGGYDRSVVTSDIGCYTLGALPPYQAIESCVCMGASVGMAKGASDAGLRPALAVIGDSTFLHSGVTGLMDAVASDTDMTLLILDNETVAMTGLQPTVLPAGRLRPIIEGLGVDPAHVRVVDVNPRDNRQLVGAIRSEMEHHGLSVVVAVRECIEATKANRRKEREGGRA
ncbi:MAG: indolepyruvate ferredoxin oxidoreductase, partial [Actinobacteria bacterium]|nr:indolepyruvate ferredoxin oxidoreductase [Actinomycetota bacterium]